MSEIVSRLGASPDTAAQDSVLRLAAKPLLVTGRSGCGKSTICRTLNGMGVFAFDADEIEGLAGWFCVKSGLPVEVDASYPVDKHVTQWRWNETVLQDFLSARKPAVLCGSADNQLDFYRYFSEIVLLSLRPDEHKRRLQLQETGGKHSTIDMAKQVVTEQKVLLEKLRRRNAFIVNADRESTLVCETIIGILKLRQHTETRPGSGRVRFG